MTIRPEISRGGRSGKNPAITRKAANTEMNCVTKSEQIEKKLVGAGLLEMFEMVL
jgi:hypothetical protein